MLFRLSSQNTIILIKIVYYFTMIDRYIKDGMNQIQTLQIKLTFSFFLIALKFFLHFDFKSDLNNMCEVGS